MGFEQPRDDVDRKNLIQDLLSHEDIHSVLSGILKKLKSEELEEIWCEFCGDNHKYDKGRYSD